jgi:Xaa-Pro aminopeptidase
VAAALLAPHTASAQPDDAEIRSRFDLEAVQGMLAVQRLDGWLLYDNAAQNPIAVELVNPAGRVGKRWFYLIPAKGQPIALVHKSEVGSFERVPGRKIEYTGHRDLKQGLRAMLKGTRRVAMEYAPKSSIPSLTRVDAGTAGLVRSVGIKIQSSANLVQFTKSLWGPRGRIAHYVAVHHLVKLRDEALAFVAERVQRGTSVTEYDVQQLIVRGYKVRGIEGGLPSVAAGVNTADPNYVPTRTRSAAIRKGDLLMLSMAARLKDAKRPIYADVTWMAYVGDSVPERFAKIFRVAKEARDEAVSLVSTRVQRRRALKGFQVDQKARSTIGKAGYADRFLHRTGHSIDTSVNGDGANLDDYETHDTRNLVMGSGFSVEPGIYFKGDFGVRCEVNVFIGGRGAEVTTPPQQEIVAILGR